jgi:hypothetical protein
MSLLAFRLRNVIEGISHVSSLVLTSALSAFQLSTFILLPSLGLKSATSEEKEQAEGVTS